MNWSKFYHDFAAAYGTCWFLLMLIAFATRSHIETGMFGVIGFPVIGAIYALVRKNSEQPTQDEVQILNERIARLEEDRKNYSS